MRKELKYTLFSLVGLVVSPGIVLAIMYAVNPYLVRKMFLF